MQFTVISGIYEVLNAVNGKRYVGSSINLAQRWRRHRKSLRKGDHHSLKLQRAWNKYGEAAFLFQVIEYVEDKEKLIEREQNYIDGLCPQYNIMALAGSNLGHKFSIESRNRLSTARKGRKMPPFTEEHKLNISKAKKGTKASDETKRKMSELRRGKKRWPCSEETKKRIGAAQLGVKRTPLTAEHKAKVSAAKLGVPQREETKLKLAISKAKISAEVVLEIRNRVSNGERQSDVAKALGICRKTVNEIVLRRTYKWVA